MTALPTSTLLAEAPLGRHCAQFHRDAQSLTESVHQFIEGGLRRGNTIVVIASPSQSERVLAHLTANKFHPRALREAHKLEMIDAETLMARFMPGGVPEWAGFRSALAEVLERVQQFGRGLRVFSEMADLLWQAGKTEAAIRIEELWNALGRLQPFALFCGFVMDTQCEKSYAGPLEDLGRHFTDILGTPEDERFSVALDRASTEIYGISLSQMAGLANQDGTRRFPLGQRSMLWVKRNLPLSTAQLAERARRYYQDAPPP